MFNCILLPPSHTGSRPLRGSRSSYTPTVDQAIVISAEGNHCKGTDPAENRALIAVPFKPNVVATDKPHPKVHGQITLVQCSVQQSMKTQKLLNEGRGQTHFNHLARNCRSVRCSQCWAVMYQEALWRFKYKVSSTLEHMDLGTNFIMSSNKDCCPKL